MRSKSDQGGPPSGFQCNAILAYAGDRKIDVIKIICQMTGLGLAEAKSLVDGVPSVIKSGIGREVAERIKTKLARVGARVDVAS